MNDAAVLQWRMNNFAKAEQFYMRAYKAYENVYGPVHPHVGAAVLNIAQFFRGTGDMDKCVKFFNQALQIFTATNGAVRF